MRIQLGCQLTYELAQPTPMIVNLNVHFSKAGLLEAPDFLRVTPFVPITSYRDSFGNWINRLVAPAGTFSLGTDTIIHDDGQPDPVGFGAYQHPVEELPSEVMVYLLGSRYCETDILSNEAWRLFGHIENGWDKVQAVCDFVNGHLHFDYMQASATRTAAEAYNTGVGVCRDYAHLAVAFCRALNIPTRYCTGYISDINLPKPWAEQDFCAWMEVYLSGRWWTFDPRNNAPRWGRVLIAIGRDASDVPLTHTFGANTMTGFKVWCDEVPDGQFVARR
ncbi:transglutaminase family protein [Fulvimarina sp. MAC3]|uniref:transglutaminase-like domain-containing protein n=1 Tax=Fulvimarina sp. MAC3 TaxID=3148887 RepID=UPI0031FCF91F